ncbi:MAG: IPT/TIG domain-containing protein [Candidatus Acidiferrum sp.]
MRLPTANVDGTIPAEAYDAALKELFISDPNFNSVEVYSTVDGHKIGEISIPGPAGLGFTPDFSKLFVGTITPNVYTVDPAALHVTGTIALPASMLTFSPGATRATLMPVMPYPMADGSLMLGIGYTSQSSSAAVFVGVNDLVRYEPTRGTFTPADPGPSDLAANPARSLDGKFLFVYGFGNAGYELLLYSSDTQGYLPVSGQVPNGGVFLAANADGSQYAAVQEVVAPGTGSFNSQVNFWGANLEPESQTYTVDSPVTSVVYSRDGKYLYLLTSPGYLLSLNTQTATPAGYESLALGSTPFPPAFFDVDETYHLFGGATGGAFILNASQMQASPPSAIPDFAGLPSTEANPNVGPLAGGTQVQFVPAPTGSASTDGVASSMEAYFGTVPATLDTVAPYPASSDGENFLTATAPAATVPGPVTVVLSDANNNTVLLPDAFTYGPHILRVEPNAISAAGGDQVTIYAYGLGFFDLGDIHVTVGGVAAQAVVQNSYASDDYPEESVTVVTPHGTQGWADVAVTTSSGSDTMTRGVQYLGEEVSIAGGPFSSAVYDAVRDVFYLTGNGNSVAVFNPNSQTLGTPLQSTSISSGAILEQETLTPDSSTLLVSDPTDQRVIVFNLVAGTSSAVSVALASDPPTTLVQPGTILASANNRALVSVTPCVTDPVREIDLINLTVQPRTDVSPSCATYVPYPEYGGASADGSTLLYAGSSGQEFGEEPSGPEYLWSYKATTNTFSGPVLVSDTPWVGGFAAADGDGGVLALAQGVLDQSLLPRVPIMRPGFDARLNETGSLLYVDGLESNIVVVSDTPNGRWHLMLNAQRSNGTVIAPVRPLAIDPTGTKIVLGTQNGVSYFELAVVPLAVGTVTPTTTPAGGTIQLRGSGFVAGTTAKMGGQNATCSFVDSETLSCTVPALNTGSASIALTNPDGQTYSFENAFVVQ